MSVVMTALLRKRGTESSSNCYVNQMTVVREFFGSIARRLDKLSVLQRMIDSLNCFIIIIAKPTDTDDSVVELLADRISHDNTILKKNPTATHRATNPRPISSPRTGAIPPGFGVLRVEH